MYAKTTLLAALLTVGTVAAAPVQAATIYTKVDFVGSFAGTPTSSISGTFTTVFDTVTNASGLSSVNVSIGGVAFTTANSGGLQFGSNEVGTYYRAGGEIGFVPGYGLDNYYTVTTGTTDFSVVIFTDQPANSYFFYTQEGWSGFGQAYAGPDLQWTITDVTGAVPEPTTWLTMIGGFGLLGGAMRRRKTAETALA